MVQIYVGNRSKVDSEILDSVKRLSDDFIVFAEFDIERNIDWFVLHLRPDAPASLVVTEQKRISKRVRGDINGQWEESQDGHQWTPMLAGGRDINPYQQATAAANALKEWLWSHQRFFLDDDQEQSADAFRIWPDLLILGPDGVVPVLPMRPSNRFGMWFFAVEPWITHLQSWRALSDGIVLTQRSVERIAERLRLTRIWPDTSQHLAAVHGSLDPQTMATKLQLLEDRVRHLELALSSISHFPPNPTSLSEADTIISGLA
jgi:hypothetical protein